MIDLLKDIFKHTFKNPYRIQRPSTGLHKNMSPVGAMTGTLLSHGIGAAMPRRNDPNRINKAEQALHERQKVSDDIGQKRQIEEHTKVQKRTQPWLTMESRQRTADLRSNRDKARGIHDRHDPSRKGLRSKSNVSIKSEWNKKRKELDKWHNTKKSKRGPKPASPGPKPRNLRSKDKTRERATKLNDAIRTGREWGTRSYYEKNAGVREQRGQKALNRSETRHRVKSNIQNIKDEYQDKDKLQGKSNRERIAKEATEERARRLAVPTRENADKAFLGAFDTGKGNSVFKAKGSSATKGSNPVKLDSLNFTAMNRSWADVGTQALRDFKEWTKPLWGDKVDRHADQMSQVFHGIKTTNGVDGYTPNMDGYSRLGAREHVKTNGLTYQEKPESPHNPLDPHRSTLYDAKETIFSDRNINNARVGIERFRNNRIDKKNSNEVGAYIAAERAEAAKHVRGYGENVDPFDNSTGNKQDRSMKQAQDRIRANNMQKTLRDDLIKVKIERNKVTSAIENQHTAGGLDAKEKDITRKLNRNRRILDYEGQNKYEHSKTFKPSEGVSGYGLGFKNYMQASRLELAGRGLSFLTGTGGGEALKNAFGGITSRQKAVMAKETSLVKKALTPGGQALIGTYASLLYTAATGGDVGDFVTTQLSYASGLQGWRVGSSVGGMIGGKGYIPNPGKLAGGGLVNTVRNGAAAGIGRGAVGFIGGVTGFAAGLAVAQGALWAASDMTSNRSAIRKIAKDFSSRTATMDTKSNRQTLTSRQMALNKLAKSGLNDRAMLLGNEARVLKGLM